MLSLMRSAQEIKSTDFLPSDTWKKLELIWSHQERFRDVYIFKKYKLISK